LIGEGETDDTVAGVEVVRGESLDPREWQCEHHDEQTGDLCLERHVGICEECLDAGIVLMDVSEHDGFVGLSKGNEKAGIDEIAVARPRDETGKLCCPVAIAAQVAVEVCLGQASEGSPSPV